MLITYIETYIGGLPSIKRNETWKDAGIRSFKGEINRTFYKGMEPKATVYLTSNGPFEWSRKNRLDITTLMQIIDIKLNEIIREEKSGTYGIWSYGNPTHYPIQTYNVVISFGCKPERVEELINATLKEIDSIRTFGISAKDLITVKEQLLREREVNLKENDWWLRSLSSNFQNNENINEILDYKNYVNNLKSEDFKTFANMYLNMKN